jgi:hypothetical protein
VAGAVTDPSPTRFWHSALANRIVELMASMGVSMLGICGPRLNAAPRSLRHEPHRTHPIHQVTITKALGHV